MTVVNQLRNLSAAEEFFQFLGVAYDPAVLNVARLHILKRMGDYLRKNSLEHDDEEGVRQACRAHLERAYQDFVESSPMEQRVFKVHKEAIGMSPLVQINSAEGRG